MANKAAAPKKKTQKISTSCQAMIALIVVIVLLTGVIAASVLTYGFTAADPYNLFHTAPVNDNNNALESDDVFILNPQSSEHVKLLAVTLADKKISRLLTATIMPENYNGNRALDWTIAFKDPSSAWASGKTVTDYVTVTPTEDGALTAEVSYVQAFGEQIIVTVSLRADSTKNATCTVDCLPHYRFLDPGAKPITDEKFDLGYDDTEPALNKYDASLKNDKYSMRMYLKSETPYTLEDDELQATFSIDWNGFDVAFAQKFASVMSLSSKKEAQLEDLFWMNHTLDQDLATLGMGKSKPGANADKYDYYIDIFTISNYMAILPSITSDSFNGMVNHDPAVKDTEVFIDSFLNYTLGGIYYHNGGVLVPNNRFTNVFGTGTDAIVQFVNGRLAVNKTNKTEEEVNKINYAFARAYNYAVGQMSSKTVRYTIQLKGKYINTSFRFELTMVGNITEPTMVTLDQDNVVFS